MNKNTVALALVATWLLGGCAAHRASNFSDGQVSAINSLVSSGEINKARIAESRAQDARVREYAEQVRARHDEAEDANEALWTEEKIRPVQSVPALVLSNEVSETLDDLRDTEANSFDKEYLDAQIAHQQDMASLIDSKLLPTTSNPELKERLMQTRAMVQLELDEARALRASLSTASR